MEAIAGGAGGEKLSEFRTFFLFICSGKGKKEKIFFQTYIKRMYERHTKGKIRLSAPGIGISKKKFMQDPQYSYCANCCNLVP